MLTNAQAENCLLQLRDGTAFFQGVVFKPNFIEAFGEEAGTEKFQEIKHLSQETAVMVTGVIKKIAVLNSAMKWISLI